MALEYQVETLEGLDETVKPLYKQDGDKFVLDVGGVPSGNTEELQKKLDELIAEKNTASARAKKAEDEARLATEEATRKAGDTEALDKIWQDKLATRDKELSEIITRQSSAISRATVDVAAQAIASALDPDGDATVLMPHVLARLAVEEVGGEYKAIVLDKAGQKSTATLDDLKAEFAANPKFGRVVIGSRASGGSTDGRPAGSNSGNDDLMKLPPLERMNAARKLSAVK